MLKKVVTFSTRPTLRNIFSPGHPDCIAIDYP
jgi:hypothetical protein